MNDNKILIINKRNEIAMSLCNFKQQLKHVHEWCQLDMTQSVAPEYEGQALLL